MLKLLEDQIISLNLNNLTPIEALNFLKEIKDKLEDKIRHECFQIF